MVIQKITIHLHCVVHVYDSFSAGLDPAGIRILLSPSNFVRSGDAFYVQLIHTSVLHGTCYRLGDSDIIVGNRFFQAYCRSPLSACNHIRAVTINNMIISKNYAFVASSNGQSKTLPLSSAARSESIPIGSGECLVGIYNTDYKCGRFKLKPPKELFTPSN